MSILETIETTTQVAAIEIGQQLHEIIATELDDSLTEMLDQIRLLGDEAAVEVVNDHGELVLSALKSRVHLHLARLSGEAGDGWNQVFWDQFSEHYDKEGEA